MDGEFLRSIMSLYRLAIFSLVVPASQVLLPLTEERHISKGLLMTASRYKLTATLATAIQSASGKFYSYQFMLDNAW